jgi:hypothetical protein
MDALKVNHAFVVSWKSPLGIEFLTILGEMKPFEAFSRVRAQRMLPCVKPRCLTERSSKSAEPFLLGAMTRNEKRTNRKLMLPLGARPL